MCVWGVRGGVGVFECVCERVCVSRRACFSGTGFRDRVWNLGVGACLGYRGEGWSLGYWVSAFGCVVLLRRRLLVQGLRL